MTENFEFSSEYWKEEGADLPQQSLQNQLCQTETLTIFHKKPDLPTNL